jgi:hypothetical protein
VKSAGILRWLVSVVFFLAAAEIKGYAEYPEPCQRLTMIVYDGRADVIRDTSIGLAERFVKDQLAKELPPAPGCLRFYRASFSQSQPHRFDETGWPDRWDRYFREEQVDGDQERIQDGFKQLRKEDSGKGVFSLTIPALLSQEQPYAYRVRMILLGMGEWKAGTLSNSDSDFIKSRLGAETLRAVQRIEEWLDDDFTFEESGQFGDRQLGEPGVTVQVFEIRAKGRVSVNLKPNGALLTELIGGDSELRFPQLTLGVSGE